MVSLYNKSIIFIGLSFFAVFCACQKDKAPEATIYLFDKAESPVADVPVRFFLLEHDDERDFIDTTIYSNSGGAANLVLTNDCFLNVWVDYNNKDGLTQFAETEAEFVTNKHFEDTLILNL